MALTQDIRPGQIGKEANKLRLKTNSQGQPQIANPNGLVESLARELAAFKSDVITEMDRLGNQRPTGPEFEPEFPAGTVKVDVSDVYDWYKLGQNISNLDNVDADEFGKGPPQTVMAFGSEPVEHKYIKQLQKLGLKTHDIDPGEESDDDQGLNEEILDEVAMSPTALRAWAASPAAEGIRAGFEAELIFRGLGSGEGESEPDYDEDRPANSISDIVDFFDDGDFNGRSDIRRLENRLREDYTEWLDQQSQEAWSQEQDRRITRWVRENYDPDQEAREAVAEENPDMDPDSDEFQEAVEQRVNSMMAAQIDNALMDPANPYHEEAQDDWREDYYNQDREIEWLEDNGLESMSAIENNYNITWPYWTAGSTEGSRDADEIGESLKQVVGMPVKVSGNYHTTKREPGVWIVETDGSLEPDDDEDGGREIVSPPMPLDQALTQLTAVIDWANDPNQGNAYTNSSTGLHMGVSIPEKGGDVDYTKLILFMGDKYVLQKFGREANTFCKSALDNMQSRVKSGQVDPTKVLQDMRNGLNDLASAAVQGATGASKYTSAHIKPGYIEFRSPGGDYLAEVNVDMDALDSTMLRFARAMQIAGDPQAEREEYAKKLYKLVAPEGNDALKYFAQYAAGELPKAALKSFVKQAQQQRQVAKGVTSGTDQTDMENRLGMGSQSTDANYEIVDRRTMQPVFLMIAMTPQDAERKYRDWLAASGHAQDTSDYAWRERARALPGSTLDLAQQRAAAATQNATNPPWRDQLRNHMQTATQDVTNPLWRDEPQGAFTGRWLIRDTSTGQTLYAFGGIGNSQADANRYAAQWAQANAPIGTDMTEVEVVPEMGTPVSEGRDRYGNFDPPGPESPPKMPAGTIKVDVSDVYDWYKLGQGISDLSHLDKNSFGKGPPSTVLAFGSEELENMYSNAIMNLGLKTHDLDEPGEQDRPGSGRDIDESASDYELHDREKLDQVLKKCCRMVIRGQQRNPEKYGQVAACVIDPENRQIFGINLPGSRGTRRHAERVAIDRYRRDIGEVPQGSIIVTTCSPCNSPMDERAGESCKDLLNSVGIHKVYAGYEDPTQHDDRDADFRTYVTGRDDLWSQCQLFAQTFLNKEDPISEAGTSLDFMHGGNVVKQKVYQTMADAGYKKVGRGADASVWTKDEGSVIKIITSGQTPFLKFYKFCRAHPDNPHLPRFMPIQGQDHAVFKLYGAKFLQVSMEKLQKIRNNSPQEFLVWYLEDAAGKNHSWDQIVTELTANQGSKLWKHSNQFPMETLQTIYKTLTKTPDRWLPLYKTIVALRKHTGSASWDLHTDNAMRRSDGTVVITDPYTD
jgi:pyrimidine deaminase RibD-like protein